MLLMGACTNFLPIAASRVMEYEVDGGQYAVVVVMDGISASEAKRAARQRAAELTVSRGNRYFTVDSEQETRVVYSEELPGGQKVPGNLYEELIIQKDFGSGRVNKGGQGTKAYPAFRLVFTSYETKPNRQAIDACSLTHCK